MKPTLISNSTRTFCGPQGLASDVGKLSIRDEVALGGVNVMMSAWRPDTAEVIRLITGQPLLLGIVGFQHPVASVSVADDEVFAFSDAQARLDEIEAIADALDALLKANGRRAAA